MKKYRRVVERRMKREALEDKRARRGLLDVGPKGPRWGGGTAMDSGGWGVLFGGGAPGGGGGSGGGGRKNDRKTAQHKECQKKCPKERQKICQKECHKICQKEYQKICQKNVRRYVSSFHFLYF